MSAFISAGHNTKGIKTDSGAVANGIVEAQQTVIIRDAVVENYKLLYPKAKIITDRDDETLVQYLKRIQTGNGSVVVEYHLDSLPKKVSGISVWVGDDADKMDLSLANELGKSGAATLGIPFRGVFRENQSYHKKLGIMREEGAVCIVEVGNINNSIDMKAINERLSAFAYAQAITIKKFDDLIV